MLPAEGSEGGSDGATAPVVRPGDLARILLAAGRESPRMRARDQQADLAGAALRRRVLDRLAILDPEPQELDTALLLIVSELGEPSGPTRGVCTALRQEWEMVQISPGYWGFLLWEAMEPDAPRGNGRPRHRLPEAIHEEAQGSPGPERPD